MRIKIIKEHVHYELGEHEVTEERGQYLIVMGVAVEISGGIYKEKPELIPEREKKEYNDLPTKRRGRPKKIL